MPENTHKWTKTTSFLLPACGLDVAILFDHGFVNAYLDDEDYDKQSSDEVDIFLLFEPDDMGSNFEMLCEVLRNHENFLDEYDPEEGKVIIRFKLNDRWKHIKEELLTSKYSKIDRDYVGEFFKPKVVIGQDMYGNMLYKDSVNYQILTKSPVLKERWEEKLATKLYDHEEVCSKLSMQEEVYRKKQEQEDYGEQII
jgi:hypothetical protein